MRKLLTKEQIASLQWSAGEEYALVNSDTLAMPFTASEENKKWLLDIQEKINSQSDHPMCNKLVLVTKSQ